MTSANGAGQTVCIATYRKMKRDPYLSPYPKLNFKWTQNLMEHKTQNMIKEKVEYMLNLTGREKMVPYGTKIGSFCYSKEHHHLILNPTNKNNNKKTYANFTSDRGDFI